VILINFTNFPNLVNAMGGVTWTGGCVDSQISGGTKDGGYSLVLRPGTHHLDGAQALVLARTRENSCDPAWSDLTREINQQKLIAAMKDQALSPTGFIRLPWIAWNAPQTLQTDMGPERSRASPRRSAYSAQVRRRSSTRLGPGSCRAA